MAGCLKHPLPARHIGQQGTDATIVTIQMSVSTANISVDSRAACLADTENLLNDWKIRRTAAAGGMVTVQLLEVKGDHDDH